jgi:MerR family transcriptional regulator, light-induced transcriptional regulator
MMRATNANRLLPIGQVVEELNRESASVSHSSLRFLEREGLIAPHRTAGGHRLYSRDDIDRIHLIKTWQAQRLTLDDIRRRLASTPDLSRVATSVRRFLLAGDFERVRALVMSANDAGMPPIRLFSDVLGPALTEVGERWHAGALSVSQEKEISEFAREVIVQLTLLHRQPEPAAIVAVAACVEGEDHELGLRMIVGALGARGWNVAFLGRDVAPRFLEEAIVRHDPAIVLLSASMPERLTALRAAVTTVRSGANPPAIFAGGRAVAAHAGEISSWGAIPIIATAIDEAISTILERLVTA